MPASLLLVGNDSTVETTLSSSLSKREFDISNVTSGRQALVYLRDHRAHSPDIIVIDIASLRFDTKRLTNEFRKESFALIILLSPTARTDASGADHIVLKSLTPKKIAARIKSVLENKPPRTMQVAGLLLDLEMKCVTRGNKSFDLTPKEFGMLKLFMDQVGAIVTRKTLIKQIWDTDYLGDTRTLDVHVRWLREKIEENASKPKRLLTVRGEGYILHGKEK